LLKSSLSVMVSLLVLIFIFLPVVIIYLTEKNDILGKIGAVIIAYIIGIIIGHCGLFDHPSNALSLLIQSKPDLSVKHIKELCAEGMVAQGDVMAYNVYKLQDILTSITILLALPLLLFSLKIKLWIRMSVKTLMSMLIAITGVILFIVIGYFVSGDDLHEPAKVAGLLVGLYTGGTPNLASLKQSLGVDVETYLMIHTYDTIVGIIYLLFIISFGKNIFRRFLPAYPRTKESALYEHVSFSENAYEGMFSKENIKGLALALLVTVLIIALSLVLGLFVKKDAFMLVVILSVTTLSIMASLITRINKIKKTFELGMFFIIVFSLVVASMADIQKLFHISASLILYISIVYFGALIFHGFFCKFFKVDADTLMVTSTALLCSPPFVPLVAGALKNKEVIVAGLTVGIMGYAVGNYLGIFLFKIL
jgi:uncharacterized membrane protein